VAAGLCPIALGTQTVGSIIRPAAYCGVAGYKPSYDRISKYGVIPLSPSLDHIGVFATDVAGVELLASQLCPDWQIVVRETKPVLGIPEGPYMGHASAEGLTNFRDTCKRLEASGCEIKSVAVMADFDEISDRHQIILAAEAAQVHSQWYSIYRANYHPKTAALIERGREIAVGRLAEAMTGRRQLRKSLTDMMDDHGLDLWISPSATGPAPKGLANTGDPVMNLPWTHSGLPTVNLPSGKHEEGLPMGLQVIGRWYEDEAVLEWCAQLEFMVQSKT
jgi:Asp-tRNA(Asn)/Glu-tRNA(Gln) amidotransferase A subunit family amidase